MVFMSDGAPTGQDRPLEVPTEYLNFERAYTVYEAGPFFDEVCSSAKSAGITIYSVAFQVDDESGVDRMRNCADSTFHFFETASGDEIRQAFEKIANMLQNLALTN
ncbi:MAG: hypothetical protein ACR2PH_11390 [Desulfobulbia bacterium]